MLQTGNGTLGHSPPRGGALSPRRVIEASLCARSREARATETRVLATLGRGRKRGGGRAAQPSEAGTPGTRCRRSTCPVHSTRCEESLFTRQCAPSVPTPHLQVCGALLKELAAARLLLKLLLLGELELAAARAFRRRRGEGGRRPVELGDGDLHHLRRVVEPEAEAGGTEAYRL